MFRAAPNWVCNRFGGGRTISSSLRALTASELAYAAHVTPQTASGHLGKLARASLIVPAQQGRHRYFRLAGAHVAAMIESISAVTAIAPPRLRPIRIDQTMRTARMCYDHIAGEL